MPARIDSGVISLGLVVLTLGGGCSEDESKDPAMNPPEEPDAAAPAADAAAALPDDPSAPLVGAFTVLMRSAAAMGGDEPLAAFQGAVRDGPPIELTTWTVAEEEGDCILLTPSIPVCDPACESGFACTTGGMCQAHPEPHSVGRVTVSGLELKSGDTEFSLTPLRPNFNYLPGASVRLAYPPVAEGDEVSLRSDGGDYSPIVLKTNGIGPLEIDTKEESLSISSEESLALKWTAPASENDSKIFIKMDISHHGGATGRLDCETADDGSLTIPQSLIAGLIGFGFAGFPTIHIARKSVGYANIEAGRVALEITSDIELPLSIPGLVSCTTPEDCESGQVCGKDRTCQ